jgi:hypothetical protein
MERTGYGLIELVEKNLGCGDCEIMLRWQFGEVQSGRGRWLRVGRIWIPMMRDILKMERIIVEVIVIESILRTAF